MKMKLRSKDIKACLQNRIKNEGSASKTEEASSKRKLNDQDASFKNQSPLKVSRKSIAVKLPRANLPSNPIILDAEASDAPPSAESLWVGRFDFPGSSRLIFHVALMCSCCKLAALPAYVRRLRLR